jgi:acetylornithine deacetylase/succinyl-diaminopimelate desuccinylase-like protein
LTDSAEHAQVMNAIERHPTLCIGSVVHGGVKTNVVPDECAMMLDRRLIPEENLRDAFDEIRSLVEMLQRQDPEMRVELNQRLGNETLRSKLRGIRRKKRLSATQQAAGNRTLQGIEAASIAADSLISQTVATCHAQIHGREPAIAISPGCNDTHYMIRDLGIPALTYGPGTTGTAHTPDEYIVIADLAPTTKVLVQVALTLLSAWPLAPSVTGVRSAIDPSPYPPHPWQWPARRQNRRR